jgi:hypothetical protein
MENSAKHFSIQLGAMIALYVSLGALIVLLFSTINLIYPDPLNQPWENDSSQSSIRTTLAMLVVFLPAYLVLTRLINTMRRATQGAYLPLTRWIIYLSLLIGSIVLLGNFATVIYNFLTGELTTRFILKALLLAVAVGAALLYYGLDTRDYWLRRESLSLGMGGVVIVLVLIAMGSAYRLIDSPAVVREKATDERQINDLMTIQNQISDHYLVTGTLPATLAEIDRDPSLAVTAPADRDPYEYRRISETEFALCAEFAHERLPTAWELTNPVGPGIKNPDSWSHGTGSVCFDRVVIPAPKP